MKEDLKKRTRQFALDIVLYVDRLPKNRICMRLGDQLLRAGTSVGANYRAACRARSGKEFRAKMGIVEEESDENGFWLEILKDSGQVDDPETNRLFKEADEITAITVSSIRTSKRNEQSQ